MNYTKTNQISNSAKNVHAQNEIKKILPLTNTPKKMKYLGIILTKCVQNLNAEKYKTLMKKSKKKILNKWRHLLSS